MFISTDFVTFGADLGSGAIKLFGSSGGVLYPSHVSQVVGKRFSDVLGEGGKRADMIELDTGEQYYTGLYAPYEGRELPNNQAADWITDGQSIRASFYAAMTEYMHNYGLLRSPLCVQAGVPVAMLTDGNAKETEQSVSKWLCGLHTWTANGNTYSINIDTVEVRSQALGALIDYAFDDDLAPIMERRESASGTIGVISIGNRTIELMVLENRNLLASLTSSDDFGVLKLLETINGGSNVGLGRLDVRLREGTLNGQYKPALKSWAQLVKGHITSKWGNEWRKFSKIILVGGGAVMLKNEILLQFAGKAILADDPYMTIACGLRKRGELARKASKQKK